MPEMVMEDGSRGPALQNPSAEREPAQHRGRDKFWRTFAACAGHVSWLDQVIVMPSLLASCYQCQRSFG